MTKNTKSFLSIILAVLMIATTAFFAFAADGDCLHSDGGDDDDNFCNLCNAFLGEDLSVDENISVVSTKGYEHRYYYRFVPSESREYIITSNAVASSPYMYLYDENMKYLKCVDSDNAERNFKLAYYFESGKAYYLCFLNIIDKEYTVSITAGCAHTSNNQTCMGYKCDVCSKYYGEADADKHDLSDIQTCIGYKCNDCGNYFGEADESKHILSDVQTCRGYQCQTCNRYFGEADTTKHAWNDGWCGLCWTGHDHTSFDENGKCTGCDYLKAFKVITGEKIEFCEHLGDALKVAENNSKIILQKDFANYENATIDKAITLDLNGHEWSQPSSASFEIRANVTFIDSVGGGYCDYGISIYDACTFIGGGYRYVCIRVENEDNLGDYLGQCCDFYDQFGNLLDLSKEQSYFDKIYTKTNHKIVQDKAVEPDCNNSGLSAGEHCKNCDYEVKQEVVSALGHIDEDGDGLCDRNCGYSFVSQEPTTEPATEPITTEPSVDDCGHICHSTNVFAKFFWNILSFFYKLLGVNQACDCGAMHW